MYHAVWESENGGGGVDKINDKPSLAPLPFSSILILSVSSESESSITEFVRKVLDSLLFNRFMFDRSPTARQNLAFV